MSTAYTTNTPALPFSIHTLQWLQTNQPQTSVKPKTQDQLELVWLQQGGGLHIVDGTAYEMKPGVLYMSAPGQQHYLSINDDSTGYRIRFAASFLQQADDSEDLLHNNDTFRMFAQCRQLPMDMDMEEINDIAARLLKESQNFFLLRSEILRKYVKIMLILMTRQYEAIKPETAKTDHLLVKRFLSLLEQHYREKKLVMDYADDLAVTPNYLNVIVKKVSGSSASQHIRQRIVLEAKRKAVYSGYSMKQVAYYLGFDDLAHFSKFFKNVSGTSFSNFKKAGNSELILG